MGSDTKQRLITTTLELMRAMDPDHISVREIADRAGVQASVVYHHFPDKNDLLHHAFLLAQQSIRQALMALPAEPKAQKLLRQRVKYHLDNAHFIVPMLRYFMAVKQTTPDKPGSFIPEQAYLHIKQAIERGIQQGVYHSKNPLGDAQVIVHSLNGFVLEHYPIKPAAAVKVTHNVIQFAERALTCRKEVTHRANLGL